MECFICMETLVAPVSWSCGHTVCILCDGKLKKNVCPSCRAKLPKERKVNLIMEELLRRVTENYDQLATDRITEVKSYECLRAYRRSTRYRKIKDCLNDCLDDNMKLSDLYTQIEKFTHQFQIPVLKQEVNMILARHKKDIALVTLNGVNWIIPGYKEAREFLGKHKDDLTKQQKFCIIARFSPYFRNLSNVSGFSFQPDEIDFNQEELLEFIQALDFTDTKEDADSGSETDSDDDVHSSDEEDGGASVNSVVLSLLRE